MKIPAAEVFWLAHRTAPHCLLQETHQSPAEAYLADSCATIHQESALQLNQALLHIEYSSYRYETPPLAVLIIPILVSFEYIAFHCSFHSFKVSIIKLTNNLSWCS